MPIRHDVVLTNGEAAPDPVQVAAGGFDLVDGCTGQCG
jgi:hypothetical protein